MRLDGFGLLVNDMGTMIRFYRDVLGFEIQEAEDAGNVYLVKDGTLFLLYGRKDFEKMTNRRYEYVRGLNGHSEIALYADTFEEARTTLEELELEISNMTDVLDEARNQFDQCTRIFRQLNRRITSRHYFRGDGSSHDTFDEHLVEITDLLPTETENEELPF